MVRAFFCLNCRLVPAYVDAAIPYSTTQDPTAPGAEEQPDHAFVCRRVGCCAPTTNLAETEVRRRCPSPVRRGVVPDSGWRQGLGGTSMIDCFGSGPIVPHWPARDSGINE